MGIVQGAFKDEEEVNSSKNNKITINTLQRTVLVERLSVDKSSLNTKIVPYDSTNLYPNLIKSIAQRSGSVISAIKTQSKFISGDGFPQMDTVINRGGATLWDLLRFISYQKSMFSGYALHFNYNIFAQITEIQFVTFEFVRWRKDCTGFIVRSDWGKRKRADSEQEFNMYDPENVVNEIKAVGGIENYKGQLYYWIPDKNDLYTVTDWDSVVDDAQLEAEAKIYSLSNIQNDFSISGIFAYPKHIESSDEIKQIKSDFQGDKGSQNAGGIKVVGVPQTEGVDISKMFHSISRNNIDGLFNNQLDNARFNIYAAFSQPPILNGVIKGGMFNKESFIDAFEFYNSQTETDRKEVERELNKIITQSTWANIGQIQIMPKSIIKKVESNGTAIN